MRIVVSDFMSLDGIVQAPGGKEEDTEGGFSHGGWSAPYFDMDVMGSVFDAVIRGSDALLFGRRTWQVMAAAWPSRGGDPFSDRINTIPKYVVSRTLSQDDLHWTNSILLPADDVVGGVRRLRDQEGGDLMIMGSATLVRTLVSNDLVDEFRLMIEPILLGGGKRIFPDDGRARPLKLVSATTASTGVLVCTYQPDGDSHP